MIIASLKSLLHTAYSYMIRALVALRVRTMGPRYGEIHVLPVYVGLVSHTGYQPTEANCEFGSRGNTVRNTQRKRLVPIRA